MIIKIQHIRFFEKYSLIKLIQAATETLNYYQILSVDKEIASLLQKCILGRWRTLQLILSAKNNLNTKTWQGHYKTGNVWNNTSCEYGCKNL